MSRRHYSSVAIATTTTSVLDPTITSLTIAAASGYPAAPFTATIEPDTSNEEVVEVTAITGTSLTITRGIDGSTGKAHASGVAFEHRVSARDFDEPNAHVNATTGVHGVTGAVVGTSDTQTLSNKALTFNGLGHIATDGSGAIYIGPIAGGEVYVKTTGVLVAPSGLRVNTDDSAHDLATALVAFTPSITNLTLGNGTAVGKYKIIGKRLRLRLQVTLGSTSVVTGPLSLVLPAGLSTPNDGMGQNLDGRIGKTTFRAVDVSLNPNATSGSIGYLDNISSQIQYGQVTASAPITEAGGTTTWAVAGGVLAIYGEIEVA